MAAGSFYVSRSQPLILQSLLGTCVGMALKSLRLIDNEEYEIKAIAEEFRKGQVISAQTLKLYNSVTFAGSNRVE
ncbi:MAG: HDOD domain-containing protein [Desulfobacterales bacterium]